eukprot:gene3942-6405_t
MGSSGADFETRSLLPDQTMGSSGADFETRSLFSDQNMGFSGPDFETRSLFSDQNMDFSELCIIDDSSDFENIDGDHQTPSYSLNQGTSSYSDSEFGIPSPYFELPTDTVMHSPDNGGVLHPVSPNFSVSNQSSFEENNPEYEETLKSFLEVADSIRNPYDSFTGLLNLVASSPELSLSEFIPGHGNTYFKRKALLIEKKRFKLICKFLAFNQDYEIKFKDERRKLQNNWSQEKIRRQRSQRRECLTREVARLQIELDFLTELRRKLCSLRIHRNK